MTGNLSSVEGTEHVNRGFIFLEDGNFTGAENEFRIALERYSRDADAYKGLGLALQQQGRTEDSEEALRKAIYLKREEVEINTARGETLRRAGKDKEAIDDEERAEQLKKDIVQLYIALGVGRLEAEFSETIQYCPEDPVARRLLGRYLWRLGQYERAEREFRAAISMKPGFEEVIQDLERCLREERRHQI